MLDESICDTAESGLCAPSTAGVTFLGRLKMSAGRIQISLIVPTYNERENIEPLLRTLSKVLSHTCHELIVVDDDSPDCTWKIVECLALEIPEIRLVRRKAAHRDQAQSLLEGLRVSHGAILGSINADGSHPPEAIAALHATMVEGEFEMVIGSRYIVGGAISQWPWHRRTLSKLATAVTRSLLRLQITDPLSGFYVVRREVYERAIETATPRGFKFLLELYVRGRPSSVAEVPINFTNRIRGKSKVSLLVLYQGCVRLLSLTIASRSNERVDARS